MFRKAHYQISRVIFLPLLITVVSGLFLILRNQITWVQPKTATNAAGAPSLTLSQLKDVAQSLPETEIKGWGEIQKLTYYPSRNLVKIQAKNESEVQIDAASGRILSSGKRYGDLITTIHEGTYFHPNVRYWIFLPSALGLLFLIISGLSMAVQRMRLSRRKN